MQNPAAHPRAVIFFANLRARKFAVDAGDGGHISYKINHSAQQANLRVVAEKAESGDAIVVLRAARVRFPCVVLALFMPSFATTFVCSADSFFLALQDIAAGEQLLYDYGDRRRDTVAAFPWLIT